MPGAKKQTDEHPTITVLERKVARQERAIARLTKERDTMSGRLGSCLHSLSETIKDRDHMKADLTVAMEANGGLAFWRKVRDAQVNALEGHITALAQRYAGVKLDCQQFTFAQAQEWLKSEREAVQLTLNRISEMQRNQCAERQREAA